MPELPEVETIKCYLERAGMVGKVIDALTVYWDKTLQCESRQSANAYLSGAKVVDLRRRGKYLIMALDQERYVVMHLRMSGRLYFDSNRDVRPYERLSISFETGEVLHFCDVRKFGRVSVTDSLDMLEKLGSEPWDNQLTPRAFYDRLQKRTLRIKALLLNQQCIAGLGNIYVDEALWLAKIHPETRANSLSRRQAALLLKAIRAVLEKGIENAGTSLGHGAANFVLPQGEAGRNRESLSVYGQQGLACPRCGHRIEKIVVAQRGTHYCPLCQVFLQR